MREEYRKEQQLGVQNQAATNIYCPSLTPDLSGKEAMIIVSAALWWCRVRAALRPVVCLLEFRPVKRDSPSEPTNRDGCPWGHTQEGWSPDTGAPVFTPKE